MTDPGSSQSSRSDTAGGEAGLGRQDQAFGDAFFGHPGAGDLAEQLRQKLREVAAREELAAATGITDSRILDRLAGLGIRPDTLAALTLFPLIQVAWADGVMQERERDAILAGAVSSGIRRGGPSFELLRIWMEDRPPPEMASAWSSLIAGLRQQLDGDELEHLRSRLLDRARAVAEAAGDLLGEGTKVSPEEEAALRELELAFST
ncbi:MAG: hypothetical protein ACQGVK_16770 [Myxococcota bacterium]